MDANYYSESDESFYSSANITRSMLSYLCSNNQTSMVKEGDDDLKLQGLATEL